MKKSNDTIMTLTRKDYVARVKQDFSFYNVKHYIVDEIAKQLLSIFTDFLTNKESISFAPEGHLVITHRKAGEIINPTSGDKNMIKEGLSIRFRKRPQGKNYVKKPRLISSILIKSTLLPKLPSINDEQAKVLIDTFINMINDVSKGDVRLEFRGFGSFNPHERSIKGKLSSIVVKFKATKKVLECLNKIT